MSDSSLNKFEKERYNRHIILEEIGLSGQITLKSSKVLVIGAGGLGSSAIIYLCAAGIGAIGIIDDDLVHITNLQRQIIHSEKYLGKSKVFSARERLKDINSEVNIKVYNKRFDYKLKDLLDSYDIVLDCTDNFESKFIINDICVEKNKPLIHAGILEFEGQIMTILPNISACYRCLFPDIPKKETLFNKGVFGVLPGVMGSLQATETIKYLLKIGCLLTNKILMYNALDMKFRKIDKKRNKNCRICT